MRTQRKLPPAARRRRGARAAVSAAFALALAACSAADAPRDGASAALDGALATDGAPGPGADCAADGCSSCGGPLELGLCRRADGGPCRGSLYDATEYVAVEDGAPVAVVLGEQGALMIGLAARTRGIDPGDASRPSSTENPALEVRIFDPRRTLLAVYRGRLAFVPAADDPALLVASAIDVVTDAALSGTIVVVASLRDRSGATRCGRLALTVVP